MSEGPPPHRRALHRLLRLGGRVVMAPVEIPLEVLRVGTHRARGMLRHRPLPPGARPGTLAIPEEAPPPQLRLFVYGPDHVEEREVTDVESLTELLHGPRILWLDVAGFGDPALLHRVQQVFGIHPLALADAVNVPQRPKVEDYDDRHLIVTRMPRVKDSGEVELEQVSLVLGPGWLVTFQERPGDVFDAVRARLRSGAGMVRRTGADYLAYALLDAVVDSYFPVLESLGEELDDLEEIVMDRPTRAHAMRIHRIRRQLLTIHRVIWRQRDALNQMVRDERSPFGREVRVYVRDVYDHSVQLLDAIETYREMAVGLMDIYLSSVSNRMNEVMKTLTVMATIFIPITFLAGVYGMNFRYMPELEWRWGYPAVWGVFIATAAGLLVWFRRRGWLGGEDGEDGGDGADGASGRGGGATAGEDAEPGGHGGGSRAADSTKRPGDGAPDSGEAPAGPGEAHR